MTKMTSLALASGTPEHWHRKGGNPGDMSLVSDAEYLNVVDALRTARATIEHQAARITELTNSRGHVAAENQRLRSALADAQRKLTETAELLRDHSLSSKQIVQRLRHRLAALDGDAQASTASGEGEK